MDTESRNFLLFWGFVVGVLFVASIVLRLLEKPMMRLIRRILPGGNFSGRLSRNIHITVGPDGEMAEDEGFSINAVSDLPDQSEPVELADLAPLDDAKRARYRESWRRTEARFFQKPGAAVREAEELVMDLMRDRGSPSISLQTIQTSEGDVLEGLSVVKDAYRFARNAQAAARGIELAKQHRENEANIVDLKRAMDHYRALFEKLIGGEGELESHEL